MVAVGEAGKPHGASLSGDPTAHTPPPAEDQAAAGLCTQCQGVSRHPSSAPDITPAHRPRASGLFIPERHQADGKQRPCGGHPVWPRLCEHCQGYQQARCEDKEPPLGPTNGVFLGTTQKDRMGWAPAICQPFPHRRTQQGANKGQDLPGGLERRHRAGKPPSPRAAGKEGAQSNDYFQPLRAPLGDRPPQERCGAR